MCEILNLGRGPMVKVWVIHVTKSRTLGQRWSGWPFPRGDTCAQRMRVNLSPWALVPFSRTVRLPGETGYSASIHIWSEILKLYQRTETQKGLFLSAGLPNNVIHSSLCFAPPPLCSVPRLAYYLLLLSARDRSTVCSYTTRWVAWKLVGSKGRRTHYHGHRVSHWFRFTLFLL